MSNATYDELLAAVRRLPPAERLRLVRTVLSEMAAEIGHPAVSHPMTPQEALAALDAIRTHFAAQGPVAPTIADDLAASRR
ncbi:MAG: hypothetical protein HC828_06625 [Blastochloris sp.]|nr:hypothetical protein [Blastochloris sp.]